MAAVGMSRSRRQQVRRKSSKICDAMCTARSKRTFNSLWQLTRTDLLFTQTSAGTPMGRDAGNFAISLLQIPHLPGEISAVRPVKRAHVSAAILCMPY